MIYGVDTLAKVTMRTWLILACPDMTVYTSVTSRAQIQGWGDVSFMHVAPSPRPPAHASLAFSKGTTLGPLPATV